MTALGVLGVVLGTTGAVNLLAALATTALSRPLGRREPAGRLLAPRPGHQPFVSVHVATHDEPLAMVIATIEALVRSDYPVFEIIVIDNNTPDRATWEPVARRVLDLGDRVRFEHRDGVLGAKAGALNIALGLTDPRARYVAVVDADYLVAPDFIARAAAACGPEVQFVQFPQVYRAAGRASAVVAELSDYFETFPRAANRAQAALLTGTLSLISIDALRKVGGWPTRSITEDAELGVRLWQSGARGLFVNSAVGDGLLPVDLAGLRLQRRRWVGGNFQTLIGAGGSPLPTGAGSAAVVAQLTAWMGLLAIPLVSLTAVAAVRGMGGGAEHPWQAVEGIAVATILCILANHLVSAVRRQSFASIAVTMSLLWTSSFGWMTALGPKPLRFRRTPKTVGGRQGSVSLDTTCSVAALLTASALAAEGAWLAGATLALTASGLFTAPLVDRWLRGATIGRGLRCAA